MANLGSIYGTNIGGSNTLVIDFSNVDICGNLKVNGTSLQMPVFASANLDNSEELTQNMIHNIGSLGGLLTGVSSEFAAAAGPVSNIIITKPYTGFKAPRTGVYNVSISASISCEPTGRVIVKTKLLRIDGTDPFLIDHYHKTDNNSGIYTVTNSTVLQMAQNEVVFYELTVPNAQTCKINQNDNGTTRINFFSVD